MQFSVGKKSRNVQDKKMYLIRCRDISIIVRNGILSTWSSSGQSRVVVSFRWLISHATYDLYETLPPSIGMSAGILTCPKEIFLVLKTQHFESLSYGKEHTKRLHFLCNTLAFIWWRISFPRHLTGYFICFVFEDYSRRRRIYFVVFRSDFTFSLRSARYTPGLPWLVNGPVKVRCE